jgi:HEAT repeat protein
VPKAPRLEDRLAALSDLRREPDSPEARKELTKCLASKINLLAAKGARIVGDCKIDALAPQLVEAFDRFMTDPATSDRRCEAKLAIAKALEDLEYPSPEPFLRGIRHVQMEPSFGPPVDTAIELRAICAIGLVRTNYPDLGVELVNLLTDKQRDARAGAARAIAYWGTLAGALLLRFKILTGDREPEVIGECFNGLLHIEGARAVDFVAGYLEDQSEAVAEGAALALGESRRPEAFEILKRHAKSYLRRTALLAIALLRSDASVEYLKSLLPDADAAKALEIYEGKR